MAGGTLASNLLAHQVALLRYLRARGAGDEAEDLLQELWLKIEATGHAGVEDELAYLYRMAHNLMIDRHRGAMRRRRREMDFQDGVSWNEAPSAERTLIARDELGRIERTLRGLGERTDYIFRRHRIDNVAQRDIAVELGISLSAVEKHLQKAYRVMGTRAAGRRNGGDDKMTEETADGRR